MNASSSSPPSHLELVQGLFVQHMPQLRGFILGLSPDFSSVDDVMQETFLTITRKSADFEKGTNFMAWAATIARYHVLTLRRREGRKAHWLSDEALEALTVSLPQEAAQPDEQLQHLDECISALAPQARRAVEMRYKHGHKSGDVAKLMGWTSEALYVALSRARTVLRECVEAKMIRRQHA